MTSAKRACSLWTGAALLSALLIGNADAQPSFGKGRQSDGPSYGDPQGRRLTDPDVTNSLDATGATSDQLRGPVHDERTGRVRPGNPSPSVR